MTRELLIVDQIECIRPHRLGDPARELVHARSANPENPAYAQWLAPLGTWLIGAVAAMDVPDAPPGSN